MVLSVYQKTSDRVDSIFLLAYVRSVQSGQEVMSLSKIVTRSGCDPGVVSLMQSPTHQKCSHVK